MSLTKTLGKYAFLSLVSLSSAVVALLFADQVVFRLVNLFSAPIDEAQTTPIAERLTVTTYHPTLGYDGVPNAREVVAGATVSQNSAGNRGPELACGAGSEGTEILVSGDAFAWGYGVSDDSTVAAALTRQLKGTSTNAPVILNFGVSGYGPDQSFLKYLLYGRECRAKLVVLLLYLGNDVTEANSESAWGAEKPRFFKSEGSLCLTNIPPSRARGWPMSDVRATILQRFPWLGKELSIGRLKLALSSTQILEFLSRREFLFTFGGGKSSGPERVRDGEKVRAVVPCYENAPTPADFRQEGPFMIVADIIAEFARVAQSDGAAFRVVLIPARQEWQGGAVDPGHLRLSELLKERKLPVTELTDTQGIPPELVMTGRADVWRPDLHFSPQGSEIVAARILFDARRDGQLSEGRLTCRGIDGAPACLKGEGPEEVQVECLTCP